MASIPRVLAVDTTDDISAIIRGAMTLLDRRFILVEVPTAEDAIKELQNTEVNLLVTAYTLADSNGIELAARAIRESAGTPVIVLADSDDPEIDASILANAPYTLLVRPVGEPFLRALRIGLDGEAAVSAQETGAATSGALELGPIPSIDEKMLRDQLMSILRDTVAMGGFIADRLGRVVYAEGMTGYFDIEVCAAVLAPHFARTVDLRDLIGGNAWSLQYFDGDHYDLFALALGLHYFVVLIFDGSKRAQFGPVTNFGRKGADSIIELIGAEAWAFRRQVSTTATQTMPAVAPAAVEVPLAAAEVRPAAPVLDLSPEPLKLDPVENLDLDALFSQQIDESQFDALFSDDDLASINTFIAKDNSVSFDEAMNMGILDE